MDTIVFIHTTVEESIEVFVDGTLLTSEWTFIVSENRIVCDSSAIMGVNQLNKVEYIILAECEE